MENITESSSFMNTLAHRVTEGIIEILKEAKAKGRSLDDVIKSFEDMNNRFEEEIKQQAPRPDSPQNKF